MCVAERPDPAGDALARYSSLSQDPREWACVPGHPCSGERLLLMFDRWGGDSRLCGCVGGGVMHLGV
jgi:inositol hexakisphosphate/diphosphoinositol-pentakisphosphate kinase